MRSVGLKVLKNRLSEYIRMVAGGETILVTDRDKVVAEIVPSQADDTRTVSDGFLAEAVREGWVAPPVLRQGGPPPRKPVCTWKELYSELKASGGPVIPLPNSFQRIACRRPEDLAGDLRRTHAPLCEVVQNPFVPPLIQGTT